MGKENRVLKNMKSSARAGALRGEGATLRNQALASFDAENIESVYRNYLGGFSNDGTAHHHFLLTDVPDDTEQKLNTAATNIQILYNGAIGSINRFTDTYLALSERGRVLGTKERVPVLDMMDTAQSTLHDGYDLVQNLSRMTAAPPAFMAIAHLPIKERLAVQDIQTTVGAEKPPEFTEAFRRYIPRWMVHGIEHPGIGMSTQDAQANAQPWGSFTEKDADYLISPAQIAEGKAPLHVVLQKADESVAQGDSDTAYALRTWGLVSVLATEAQHMQGDKPESPLFTHALGGLIADYPQPAPKHAHYDYGVAIDDTMRDTFTKLPEELQNEPGVASTFLMKLSQSYGENFPSIVALAITKYDANGQGIDMFPILKGLETNNQPWTADIREAVKGVGVRRVIASSEVEDIAGVLPQRDVPDLDISAQVIADATAIVGDRDIIDFKVQVNKMYPDLTGPRLDMEVELDRTSETIQGRLSVDTEDTLRYVPFTLSFAGDTESLQFPTIDDAPLSTDVLSNYRGIVIDALQLQAEKVRRNTPQAPKNKETPGKSIQESPSDIGIGLLGRDERMAMYAQQRERAKRKDVGQVQTGAMVPGELVSVSQPSQPEVAIHGLERTNVRGIFDAQGITAVTPDRLIARVESITESAVDGDKPLGKPVNLESFGPEAADINLRQISWTIAGKHATVLVFVEDKGDGEYVFRGATERKGKQQATYITEMVNDILIDSAPVTSD